MADGDMSGVVGGGGARRGTDSDDGFSGGGSDTDAPDGVTGDDGSDTTFGGGADDDGSDVSDGFGGDSDAGDAPDPSDSSGVVGGGGARRGDDGSDTTFGGGGVDTDAPDGATGGGTDTTFEGGRSEQNRTQTPAGDTGTEDPAAQPDPEPDRGVSFTTGPGGETVVSGGPDRTTPRVEVGETTDRGVGVTRGPEGTTIVTPMERDRDPVPQETPAEQLARATDLQRRRRSASAEISRAEVAAATTRFGQRQLEASRPSEQFGDIPVASPFSDRRLETDLRAGGEAVREFLGTSVEAASRGAPAAGPFAPLGGLRTAEQTAFAIAEQAGLAENTPREGEFERVAEEGFVSAADAFNPPSAAAEGKEIAEFAITQPGRIAADSETAVSDREADSPLPGLIGDAVDTAERGAETEFAQDVEQRTQRVASTIESDVRADPAGTAASAVGGLAGGFAIGAGLGRAVARVPGVSGSDVSGRILQGAARTVQGARRSSRTVLEGGGTDRAMVGGGGRSESLFGSPDGDDTPVITGEDIDPRPDEPNQAFADPSDALPERDADIDAGDAFERRRQRRRIAPESRDPADVLDPRDRDRAVMQARSRQEAAQERSVDVDDTAPAGVDAATAAAAGAGVTVPGLVGRPTDVARATQSGGLFGADSLTDSGAAVGPDTLFGSDTATRLDTRVDTDTRLDVDTRLDTDPRTDGRVDLDTRTDTRVDIREDTRFDTRFDTRQDTRVDTRQDTRIDTREDVRADTRADFRFDTDLRRDLEPERRDDEDDEFLAEAFGTRRDPFTNPVETVEGFLGDSP
jgi:hypothetical protein